MSAVIHPAFFRLAFEKMSVELEVENISWIDYPDYPSPTIGKYN